MFLAPTSNRPVTISGRKEAQKSASRGRGPPGSSAQEPSEIDRCHGRTQGPAQSRGPVPLSKLSHHRLELKQLEPSGSLSSMHVYIYICISCLADDTGSTQRLGFCRQNCATLPEMSRQETLVQYSLNCWLGLEVLQSIDLQIKHPPDTQQHKLPFPSSSSLSVKARSY